jgi:hypothetical protein
MGERMGRKPKFRRSEEETTCAGDTSIARKLFGTPRINAEQLMDWVADWVQRGGETIGKPTHFEVRDGRY